MAAQPYQLTVDSLPRYLLRRGLIGAGESVRARELGGGVSNTVVMVERASAPSQPWVAKQALAKLRVEDEWLCGRERILREADAIESLIPILGAASLPRLIHVDREAFLYVMAAAPAGSRPWKELLMAGHASAVVARKAGEILARLMRAGVHRPEIARRFSDQTVFDQLRIDPYYRTTEAQHKDLHEVFELLIADSKAVRTSLVHGDFSPKNMLVRNGRILLIDFEVVHWGDPAFDAAFLLNHLCLKSFYRPRFAPRYARAVCAFWQSLLAHAGRAASPGFERMTVRHLGALMLARIDGKSPVEYIHELVARQRVRSAARALLLSPPATLPSALEIVRSHLAAAS